MECRVGMERAEGVGEGIREIAVLGTPEGNGCCPGN